MAINVKPLEAGPILLAEFEGPFTIDDVYQMYRQSIEMVEQMGTGKVWRLIDFSQSHIDFADVMTILKRIHPDDEGGLADPSIESIFCPSHPMAKLLMEMLAKPQYGGIRTTMLPGLGEAMFYVQDAMDHPPEAGV